MITKLKNWLKKYFIPHSGNDHKPHFLRLKTSVIILSAVLFIEILFLVQILVIFPNTKFFASILPSVLVDLTNENRQNNNYSPLIVNPLLEKAAALKAQDMAEKSYFSHISPDGHTPWYWFEQVGYNYIYAGENLAVNFSDSKDIETAWMNSPGHRQNIENSNFTQIGIASARGIYQGRETIFVVQLFGTPVQAQISVLNKVQVPTVEEQPVALNQPKNQATSSGEENSGAKKVEGISSINYSSIFKRIISTPHATTNYFYFVLATIIALSLVLTIFVKINIQYPRLIISGVLMLLIISSVLLVNQYIIPLLGQIN